MMITISITTTTVVTVPTRRAKRWHSSESSQASVNA